MKYTPRQGETNFNVSPSSIWRELFVLLAGLLAILAGLYLVMGLVVDLVAERLSPEFEARLGAAVSPRFHVVGQDDSRQRCLQQLADRIQDRCVHLPYHFKVQLVEDPRINAFALPGGIIMVLTGLLDRVETENELAFILGHEMGHFANRDHLRRMGRTLVLLAVVTIVFGPDSSLNNLVTGAMGLAELGFSRQQETAADQFGLKVLKCFYGNSCGADDFFAKIPKESDPGRFGHYFSSHPENRRRISHLRSLSSSDCRPEILKPLPECIVKGK